MIYFLCRIKEVNVIYMNVFVIMYGLVNFIKYQEFCFNKIIFYGFIVFDVFRSYIFIYNKYVYFILEFKLMFIGELVIFFVYLIIYFNFLYLIFFNFFEFFLNFYFGVIVYIYVYYVIIV